MQFHPTTLKANGVLITEGCRGEGGVPAQRRRRALHGQLRAERDGARLARRRLPRGVDRDRRRAAASTAACCSTSPTSAPKKINDARCPAPASWRWTTPASTRSTSRSRSGRAPTTTWAASTRTTGATPICPACGPPARSPACRCTAPTASAATRCSRPSSSAAAPAQATGERVRDEGDPARRIDGQRRRRRAAPHRRAAVARHRRAPRGDPRASWRSDVRQGRRVPHRGHAQGGAARRRRAARALRSAAGAAGQGPAVQLRPDPGARAAAPAGDGRLPRHRRARPRRRAAAPTRASTSPSATTSAG